MHRSLCAVRDEVRVGRPPIVVFNKSHSGSRLLARVLAAAGIFMGAHRNDSEDALDIRDLVFHLVRYYYRDYSRLWRDAGVRDDTLPALVREVMRRHLEGFDAGAARPWGWKLCETTYAVPVIDFLFPGAKFIHLIRDGRDVAFCDHHAPGDAVWKKIYFDTPHIATWRGYALNGPAYRRRSYVYNAMHWVNSVRVGRTYGAMLRERYLEARYEDLCTQFRETVSRVLDFAGLGSADQVVAELQQSVRTNAIGKHRRQPWWQLRRVLAIEKPELLSLGYLPPE
jgi:hypothetical protein